MNAKPLNIKDDLAPEATDQSESKPDVRALMADIRARIKADIERNKDKAKPFSPFQAQHNTGNARKAGELLHSEELRYLNANYAYARLNLDGITSHRPGIIGRAIVKVKRKLLSVIWDNLLKDYFSAEREFQANVVRFLNDVSKYVDSRDASNFWELIRKIDYDVTKALERIERIHDEQMASLRSSERRVFDELHSSLKGLNVELTKLQGSAQQHGAQLRTLDDVARGLEGVVARMHVPLTKEAIADGSLPTYAGKDYSYLLLENRFRGGEDEIAHRLAIYPPLFAGASKPILEIGGGRGELQSLFKSAGINSYGIDLDAAMVQISSEKGFNVRCGDGIAHLRDVADGSLGGVIAIQVVEHLSRQTLQELFTLCTQKVTKGGKIIFETINPQSLMALSSNYFRDPTHVWPLHPDTLRYAMELSGLKVSEVRYLSPVPAEAQLHEISSEVYMTPRWAHTVETINHNLRQLNSLIYGYQDYCIIAEVP